LRFSHTSDFKHLKTFSEKVFNIFQKYIVSIKILERAKPYCPKIFTTLFEDKRRNVRLHFFPTICRNEIAFLMLFLNFKLTSALTVKRWILYYVVMSLFSC